jgi:hypothetical protein
MTRAPICIEAFRIPEKMPGNPLDRVCQGDGNVCQLMTTHQEARPMVFKDSKFTKQIFIPLCKFISYSEITILLFRFNTVIQFQTSKVQIEIIK